jgi:hypothetical protein
MKEAKCVIRNFLGDFIFDMPNFYFPIGLIVE